MKTNPSVKLKLEGHTCNEGNKVHNQKLSEKRAESIKSYIEEMGIEDFRLDATGYGETNPAHSNMTERGREMNRRIEIIPVY